ncbi:unnamed protein product [Musa acuminata subsp. burmannicoides]
MRTMAMIGQSKKTMKERIDLECYSSTRSSGSKKCAIIYLMTEENIEPTGCQSNCLVVV